MWLIAVDAYTKWLDVVKMKVTTAVATCNKLRELFGRYGVPRVLVSDNGPQWVSEEYKSFCASNLIQPVLVTPYHPKSNGLAERAVRTFKERMSAAKSSTPDINIRLHKFLLSYRNAPHKSTGRPPAELMFGRRLRTRLDLLKPDVRARLESSQFRQQRDHDRRATPRAFAAGDPVWVLQTSGAGYLQGTIVRRTGPLSYVVNVGGVHNRKHADQLRFRRAEADGRCEQDEGIEDTQFPLSIVPPTLQMLAVPAIPLPAATAALPAAAAAGSAISGSIQDAGVGATSGAGWSAVSKGAGAGKPAMQKSQHAQQAPEVVADAAAEVVLPAARRSQRARRCPLDPYAKYL